MTSSKDLNFTDCETADYCY